jgi:hypothetical protein
MENDDAITINGKKYTAERVDGKSWRVRRIRGAAYDEVVVELFTNDPTIAVRCAIAEGGWQ